jgi:hypothetical protein
MPKCGGCGEVTTRIRITYHEDKVRGKLSGQSEECDKCKPDSFDPRWKHERGAMGWEAYPTKYRMKTAADGNTIYVATDEFKQDTEDWIANAGKAEEKQKYDAAAGKKRAHRRTKPLTAAEIERAKNKVRAMRQVN